MVVILLGPPGVGKGTQAVRLAEDLGWRHVSTGDLLRAHRRDGTPLGKEAQGYMDRGELVPDPLIVAMVRDVLEDTPGGQGVVFDGYPRTVAQAEALDGLLSELGRRVDRVVLLDAEDEVLVERLAGRRSCPECGAVYNVYQNPPERPGRCDRCGAELIHRRDDEPDTVRRRLQVYAEQTAPLVQHYDESDEAPLVRVPADRSVEEVQAAVRAAVEVNA